MDKRKQLAKESLLRFSAEFARKGWDVFLPLGEDGPIDLVVYKDSTFRRVQVKTRRVINGALQVKLRSTNNWRAHTYSCADCDLIGAYDYENNRGYLFSLSEFEGMTEVSLRLEPAKNGQQKVRDASKYLFFG